MFQLPFEAITFVEFVIIGDDDSEEDREHDEEECEYDITIAFIMKESYIENWKYIVIDAPRHRDFPQDVITDASQTYVALLTVSVKAGKLTGKVWQQSWGYPGRVISLLMEFCFSTSS